MRARFLLVLLVFSPSLAQNVDSDDVAFDWLKFSKDTENEYVDDPVEGASDNEDWDAEQPLDIADRGISDYDFREAPPFQKTCEIHHHTVPRNPSYDYKPHPMYNVTCSDSSVKEPLSYSRHLKDKEFCILRHQRLNAHDLCQTIYAEIPMGIRRKGKHHWHWEKQKFGIGCKCYRAINPWYGVKHLLGST